MKGGSKKMKRKIKIGGMWLTVRNQKIKKRQFLEPGKLKELPPKNKPYIYILKMKGKKPLYIWLYYSNMGLKKRKWKNTH